MGKPLQEIKERLKVAQGRFAILDLKDAIEGFIRGPEFSKLCDDEKDRIMDLLAEVLTKLDGCKGCDPLKTLLGK